MRGYFTRVVCVFAVAVVAAGLGGCAVEIENHSLTSVAIDQPGRGTATEIAVPPADAPAVTIAAIESDSFAVHGSDIVGERVRLLVSQGMTAWSGGEVGRVDLSPASDGKTGIFTVVQPLASQKGAASVEGKFLPEWQKTIAERYATLTANRAAGRYEALRVGGRQKGEAFSTSGRGAVLGFLAGGIAGAIVGGQQDEKRGMRMPWIYELTRSGGAPIGVRSFSPAVPGACVGLADDSLEPVTYERVLAARQAMAEAEKPKAEFDRQMVQTAETPPDPTADIVILVPLPSVAC